MSDNIKNSFEVWKEKNSDCFVLGTLGNSKYLENRLWHAYHGGLNERQAEVESLTKQISEMTNSGWYSDMNQKLFNRDEQIEKLTKELEALREENRWIPVSEQKPPTDVWVLGWHQFGSERPLKLSDKGEIIRVCWNKQHDCFDHFCADQITHWRPLPSVPK